MTAKAIPDGYHTLTPYMTVHDAARALDFYKRAFGAVEKGVMKGPDGKIMHAAVRIGDSMVELGDSPEPMPMNLHVYVDDVDSLYQRAIAAGGISIREPETKFYGDREAGVKDPGGNKWWIACHVEDLSHEEIMRRATQQKS